MLLSTMKYISVRRVGHFGEELFATGAANHGYDALNMRIVFRKIPRREGDVAEEGQWRGVVYITSTSIHHCPVAPPTPSAGGAGIVK